MPEVFIAKPDSIKVKVSKKTIMIRSTVDEGGRSSTLKVIISANNSLEPFLVV